MHFAFDTLAPVPSNDSDPRLKRLRGILRESAKTQISSIEILESNIFAPQTIHLDRLTGIVGRHGTGKTLLLRLLDHAFGLAPVAIAQTNLDYLGEYGTPIELVADVTVCLYGRLVTHRVELASGAPPGFIRYRRWKAILEQEFSPHAMSVPLMLDQLQQHFQNMRQRDPSSEHSQYKYSADDLGGVRNIIGRDYSSVTAHSFGEHYNPDPPTFAFTAVDTDGAEISTTMMSLGEIWTHYLLGHDYLVPDAHDPRLIDEPESFLAPRAHRPMIDELIRRALLHKRQLVISTHSPQVLSRFPEANLRMCTRTPDGIRVARPTSFAQIHDALGLDIAVRVVVLVEDEFAAAVFRLLCEKIATSLIREVEVVPTGGAGEVIHGLRALSSATRIRYVGVLDGNERSEPIPESVKDRLFFLPGHRSPEGELQNVAARAPAALADELGCSAWDVEAAVDSAADLDHQYWISRVAQSVARSPEVLTHALVTLWMHDGHAAEFIDVVYRIRAMTR